MDVRCPSCDRPLALFPVHVANAHVNACMDQGSSDTGPAAAAVAVDGSEHSSLTCGICGRELSALSLAARELHANRCLDDVLPPTRAELPNVGRRRGTGTGAGRQQAGAASRRRRTSRVDLPLQPKLDPPLKRLLELVGLSRYGKKFIAHELELDMLSSLSADDWAQIGLPGPAMRRILDALRSATLLNQARCPPAAEGEELSRAEPASSLLPGDDSEPSNKNDSGAEPVATQQFGPSRLGRAMGRDRAFNLDDEGDASDEGRDEEGRHSGQSSVDKRADITNTPSRQASQEKEEFASPMRQREGMARGFTQLEDFLKEAEDNGLVDSPLVFPGQKNVLSAQPDDIIVHSAPSRSPLIAPRRAELPSTGGIPHNTTPIVIESSPELVSRAGTTSSMALELRTPPAILNFDDCPASEHTPIRELESVLQEVDRSLSTPRLVLSPHEGAVRLQHADSSPLPSFPLRNTPQIRVSSEEEACTTSSGAPLAFERRSSKRGCPATRNAKETSDVWPVPDRAEDGIHDAISEASWHYRSPESAHDQGLRMLRDGDEEEGFEDVLSMGRNLGRSSKVSDDVGCGTGSDSECKADAKEKQASGDVLLPVACVSEYSSDGESSDILDLTQGDDEAAQDENCAPNVAASVRSTVLKKGASKVRPRDEDILAVIRNSPKVYDKMLVLEPVCLEDVLSIVTAAGYRIGAAKLADFLDRQGVNYKASRKEESAGRRQEQAYLKQLNSQA